MTELIPDVLETTIPEPEADTELVYFPSGQPVKAIGEDRVGGYLVVFGSAEERDLQGEYFTRDTEYHLDWYEKRPMFFHHALDETVKGVKIGDIDTLKFDDVGLWAEGILDMRNAYIQKIKELVQRGVIGWSSGALPQRAIVDTNGHIKEWGIIEGSLTPTPAEPRRTDVNTIKTAMTALEDSLIETKEPLAKGSGKAVLDSALNLLKHSNPEIRGVKMSDLQALLAALEEAGISAEQQIQIIGTMTASEGGGEAEPPAPPPEDGMMADDPTIPPPQDQEEDPMMKKENTNGAGKTLSPADIVKIVQAAMKTAPATETLPGAQNENGVTGKGAPAHIEPASKWDNMSLEDITFVKTVMDAASRAKGSGPSWSPKEPKSAKAFWRNMGDRMMKAQADGRVLLNENAIKAIAAMKTDELNYSTLATFGDEFVPEGWSAQLWRKPRIDNVVTANTTFIEMPTNPYKLPIESTDPTVYSVPETTNEAQLATDNSSNPIPDSQVATANTTMTAKKLGLRVGISEELNEDSIIPVATLWREQSVRAMEDARDNVLLNSDDTTGTTNINYADGNTSAVSTAKFLYGGGDGFMHLPLVTNPALGVDGGATEITLTMLRNARAKLGRALISDLNNLVWYVDPLVYVKLQNMDEVLVQSVNGRESTVNTGMVGRIDNIPVFVSNEIAQSTTAGKVSATAANNVRGRILLVHKPSWYAGYRREIRTNFDYMPVYDAWQLVVTMRLALVRRTTDCASLIYNLAI